MGRNQVDHLYNHSCKNRRTLGPLSCKNRHTLGPLSCKNRHTLGPLSCKCQKKISLPASDEDEHPRQILPTEPLASDKESENPRPTLEQDQADSLMSSWTPTLCVSSWDAQDVLLCPVRSRRTNIRRTAMMTCVSSTHVIIAVRLMISSP